MRSSANSNVSQTTCAYVPLSTYMYEPWDSLPPLPPPPPPTVTSMNIIALCSYYTLWPKIGLLTIREEVIGSTHCFQNLLLGSVYNPWWIHVPRYPERHISGQSKLPWKSMTCNSDMEHPSASKCSHYPFTLCSGYVHAWT